MASYICSTHSPLKKQHHASEHVSFKKLKNPSLKNKDFNELERTICEATNMSINSSHYACPLVTATTKLDEGIYPNITPVCLSNTVQFLPFGCGDRDPI